MNRLRAGLYAVSAGALVLALLLDPVHEPADIVEPVPRATAAVAIPTREASATAEAAVLRLRPRQELVGPVDHGAKPAALFQARAWVSTASAPSLAEPSLPALPFAYVGKQQVQGEWQVFLADKDGVNVVKTGDVLAGGYVVRDIAPPTLTLEYTPLHRTQPLQIE